MSYVVFKQNMLSYMRNQRAIGSKEDFAKKLVQEYDALVHRGYDMINKITVSTGNTELMESTLIGVLNTAFQQSAGEHPLYTNLGPVFQAYWTGATMNLFPPPLPTAVPAPAIHIAQVSNSITNTGTWNGRDSQVIPPEVVDEIEDTDEEDLIAEGFAIAQANTLVEEEEQDTIPQGLVFGGFDLNFGQGTGEVGGPNPIEKIRRNAGQSNSSGRSRGRKSGKSCLSDPELFQVAGRGEFWPAKGTYPNFELSRIDDFGTPWFVENPEYFAKFTRKMQITLADGTVQTFSVHVDLASLLIPAFEEINSLGLNKWIKNCAGTKAVRNVRNSSSLSNHAWALAVDINSRDYPFENKPSFRDDGYYENGVKKRDYTEQDLGHCKVAEVILKHGKGTLQWLTGNDPMHISLYECTWNGIPSFVKPFG
jgi:hypothetical protein